MNKRYYQAIIIIAFTLLMPHMLLGQGTATSAVISGRIENEVFEPIPRAKITVQHIGTGNIREAYSNEHGTYRFDLLPPGDYRVNVYQTGFDSLSSQKIVSLYAGDTLVVNLTLRIRIAEEHIEVTANPNDLDVIRTLPSRVVDSTAIETLPARGRRFQDLILTTPGAVIDTQRGELSIGGQRGINLAYNIDGVSNDNAFFGGGRGGERGPGIYTLSLEAIDAISVTNAGYGAEYGRSGGGVVSLTTKSGTNAFRGSVFEYFRGATLTATDPFGRKQIGFRQHQFGASFSGPIRRNIAHFFFAYDQQLQREPFIIAFGADPRGIPRFEGQGGTFQRTNDVSTAFLRVDWQLKRNGRFSFLSQWARNNAQNDIIPERIRIRTLENTGTERNEFFSFGVQHMVELPRRILSEFRFHFGQEVRPRKANTLQEPQIIIAGFGTTGQSDILPSDISDRRFQIVEIITAPRGNHILRAGADINLTRPRQPFFLRRNGGEYFFNSLNDYLITISTGQQRWNSYRQGFGRPDTDMKQQEYAVFLQDTLKISETLSTTYGLRYEVQLQPQPDLPNPNLAGNNRNPSDFNNFAPRLGLAWQPWNRAVVRLNAGIYYSRTPAILLVAPFRINGLAQQQLRFSPQTIGAPIFPNRLPDIPNGTILPVSDAFTFDQNFQNPQTSQLVATFETKIWGGVIFETQLQRAWMRFLERLRDINLGSPSGTAVDGRNLFQNPRPNPRFARIVQAESSAKGAYSSFTVGFRKIFQNNLGFLIKNLHLQFHYTYALSKDDDSNERDANSTSYQDVNNLRAEYTWSNNDVRHNFVWMSSAEIKGGFNFATIFRARTGTPYTIASAVDLNFDGNTNGTDRLYVNGRDTGRNSFRQPDYTALDLRLSKRIRFSDDTYFDVGFDLLNALNSKNLFVSSINTTFTGVGVINPNLGVPDLQLGEPRNAKFFIRFAF